MPARSVLVQIAKQTLYALKRAYGAPIDVYKLVSSETEVTTGVKTVSKTVFHIKRAAVLPGRLDRKAVRGISLISSNKQLVEGGTYDAEQRNFVVDRRDCPNLPELTADDWIVFENKKFQIQAVEDYEYDTGWIIAARQLKGEVPERIINLTVVDLLGLEDNASQS